MSEGIYLGNNIFLSEEDNHLIKGNITLTISEKEKRLLSYFVRHPEVELTKRNLIENIWENRAATIDDANLTQLVYKIRRDLAAVNMKNCIKTIPGKGYVYLPQKGKPAAAVPAATTTAANSKTEWFVCSTLTVTAVMALIILFFFMYR